MSDEFSKFRVELNSPAREHYVITPGAALLDPMPRVIYVSVGGSATIEDINGVSVSYPLVAGQTIPFRASKVTAATATLIAWL